METLKSSNRNHLRNGVRNGFFSFLVVLLLMPIGHALMILNEELLHDDKYIGAFVMGLIGMVMVVWGIFKNKRHTLATLLGFLGGILLWTGWIEFSFVWIAEENNVSDYIVNGEVQTKKEYLVMLSSVGLLLNMTLYFIFTRTYCNFFIWIQKYTNLRKHIMIQKGYRKPLAVTTFIETIMLLWFFYILLLIVYNPNIAGDRHIATYITAYGSLIWSLYLIVQLFKIQTFDYAIRYAVPTVIIFWNFVEVIGRWELFDEIWVEPIEYWLPVSGFFVLLFLLLFIFIKNPKFNRKKKDELLTHNNL
ncbi:MAG: hypothetical protein LC105_04590 [Chitinophagales bacterium]|nr:hypothetical protein [Chitinophagales bacterium]MCZ2393120.1 hypothetical protein [Chitinophagales bacterium]